MRHLIGLSGCLLLLSCSLNSDNLTNPTPADAGGSGGATDCPRCGPTGGTTGLAGAVGSGGTVSTGGVVGTGGALGTGGAIGTGGALGTGGRKGTGTGGVVGTGGAVGTGGDKGNNDGGESCGQLESDYANALTDARSCTPGAQNQCQKLVDSSISCPGCKQYVNDTTTLDAITAAWDAANCGATPHACPAIACVVPTTVTCVATSSDNGPNAGASPGGTCASLPTVN